MKKIEASLIKRLLSIRRANLVSVTFCQFSFEAVSLFFLSLILLDTWSFLEHFGIGERNKKNAIGSKDQAGKGRIKQLQQASLQVSTCMSIFVARFGMHGIACVSFLPCYGFCQVLLALRYIFGTMTQVLSSTVTHTDDRSQFIIIE